MANPNAPRIEFFTSDNIIAAPGDTVNLFWSTRGGSNAVIYQLDRQGNRNRLWNVQADGRLTVQTRASDRGQLDFLLVVGDGALQAQQTLSIPLACSVAWFFTPSPDACPDRLAQETRIIDQTFERGRMVYVESSNLIYVLFNDGQQPAWVAFQNRYDPAIHPESEERFVPPPGLVQPIARLGFLWRGNDTVRNRLGLGIIPEFGFDGFVQTANDNLYISSTNATIIQLVPAGSSWQIITLP